MSNVLSEAAAMLRSTADGLERMAPSVTIPVQEYTLSEALGKLRAVTNGGYVAVTPPTLHWHRGEQSPTASKWTVYDGRDHFEGPSLAAAVNACVADHAPRPADVVDHLQDVLQPVAF